MCYANLLFYKFTFLVSVNLSSIKVANKFYCWNLLDRNFADLVHFFNFLLYCTFFLNLLFAINRARFSFFNFINAEYLYFLKFKNLNLLRFLLINSMILDYK